MKAYITKWVLTRGIIEVEGELTLRGGFRTDVMYYQCGEWYIDRDDAVQRAEQLRRAKLKSLRRAIDRIKSLDFTE